MVRLWGENRLRVWAMQLTLHWKETDCKRQKAKRGWRDYGGQARVSDTETKLKKEESQNRARQRQEPERRNENAYLGMVASYVYNLSIWEAEAGSEFEARLGYIMRPCLKTPKITEREQVEAKDTRTPRGRERKGIGRGRRREKDEWDGDKER